MAGTMQYQNSVPRFAAHTSPAARLPAVLFGGGLASWRLRIRLWVFTAKNPHLGSTLSALLTALALLAPPCLADDKSGVTPNTISVPTGPGAIEGLGESFQPTLNTGTASYGISLKVPPGTAGHAPALRLAYEGGGGNGPLGFGWSLPMPCVQRRADLGIPRYLDSLPPGDPIGRVDLYIDDSKEQLVPQANGDWFHMDEGAFIRYRQVNGHWEGTLPNGTRMDFGLTDAGRIEDPAFTNHVFSWLLEQETDTHGNVITYTYTNFPGSNNLNQKYLAAIAYGPGAPPWNNFHFITFSYEDRPDWFEDCRSGFIVRTGKRLKQIVVGTQGPTLANHLAGDFNGDGLPDYLDREYVLDYLNYAGTNSYWSLLASVTPVGADGTSSLPPATFGYSVCNPPDTLSAAGYELDGTNEPPFVMDNPLVDLVDLNGDGLPDILKTEADGGQHTAYLNEGELDTPNGRFILWSAVTNVASADGLAYNVDLQSTTEIAHLADMNGDGAADLVYTTGDDVVYYFQNLNSVAWGPRELMAVQNDPPPSPFGSVPNVRTADVDFDKRMDIIQSIDLGGGSVEYRIWFNLGNQTYSPSITTTQNFGFVFSDTGVQIADFNGDRVPDIAQIRPTDVIVTAGLGYGNFATQVSVSIPDIPGGMLTDAQIAQAKLMDITGDGLADLVIERPGPPGELWYWVNLGNYTFSTLKVITGMPTGIGANAVVRWADINGNGSTDLIYADHTFSPHIRAVDLGQLINGNLAPNLLTAISNGIGRVTFIGYASSTSFRLQDLAAGNPWPDPLPFPVQVAAAVTNLDSLGHQYVTQFSYHNGYYDPVEKQFRGFGGADQTDLGDPTAPTLVTRSVFDTGQTYEAMKGKLLMLSTEQQDGSVFSSETHSWTIPPVTLYTGTDGTNVSYASPTAKFTMITELGQGAPVLLESEFAYDNYGNETTNADYGIVANGNLSAGQDERIITTVYAINTNAWILRCPARQETSGLTSGVLSRVESYYDDETFSGNNFGQVTVGNLTLRREWTDASNPGAYVQSARRKYDGFGNPITLLDPLAVAPGGGADFTQGHGREIAYDGDFESYPTAETIHVGNGSPDLVFQAAYDEGFGTVTSSLDFNSNQTTYGYDVFARLINIVKPYDTPAYPTVEYNYALAVPTADGGLVNFVETLQLDQPLGSAGVSQRNYYFISRQFVDGLGRKLMTKTEAEPAAGSATPRVVISGAVQFNAREKPAHTLNPCFSLQGAATLDGLLAFENIEDPGWQGQFEQNGTLVSLTLAGAQQSASIYDATLREIMQINQDGTYRSNRFEPLITRSFDENQTDPTSQYFGASMAHYNDGLGRMVQVDENTHLNNDGTAAGSIMTWTTRYEYDVNDQLTQITDSQNNVKTFTYDGLKRKTGMNDPDRGIMQWNYDLASNVTNTFDAKGQQIVYAYDGVNRLLAESYLDGTSPNPAVSYHYDTPVGTIDIGDGMTATPQNTKGMLAYVQDLSGEKHTSYDARGRVAFVVKRIPDPLLQYSGTPSFQLVSYRTGFTYDSLDRVTTLTYPDDDFVNYGYNTRNLLNQIVGGPSGFVISNILYQPSAQLQEIDYGNSVRTTYGYDPRLRLNSLITAPTANPASPLIAFTYDFDGVSNIKDITDNRPSSVVASADPRRNTQLFAYDDLYRITQAQYSFNAPSETVRNDGQINYRYDRIGNMLAQTSSLSDTDPLTGLLVANLGQMTSGGSAGTANRIGRAASDPPGPHALTSISNLQSPISNRLYSYDANGNMTVIDGLTNTWDFKDRLISVENTNMRAVYAYDYSDHRISKVVFTKTNGVAPASPTLTTLYIDKYFEVRDHDAPTKYVWNGNTRVAHVTGSLSSNQRVQRVRLWPGYNLISVAVNGATLPANPALTAYQWNPGTLAWSAVSSGTTLSANSVLWVQTATNGVLTFTGSYSDPTDSPVASGPNFVGVPGLESLTLTNTNPQLATNEWRYDAQNQFWQFTLTVPLTNFTSLPTTLAPGEVLFLRAEAATQLTPTDPTLRVRYYHQDHLGSSSTLTDTTGQLAEERANYPFGHARRQFQPRTLEEPYQFSQKEEDQESGLQYFGARYLASYAARFSSVDPLSPSLPLAGLSVPQKLNPYAYAVSNPLRFTDPDGNWVFLLPFVVPAVEALVGAAEATLIVGTAAGAGYALNEATKEKDQNQQPPTQKGKELQARPGAKDAPLEPTAGESKQRIYGPRNDPKINPDGSTKPNTWTTPDEFGSTKEATDKLDPFKEIEGYRDVTIPKGTPVKQGVTPGNEGPYQGRGGANETLIPEGLPPGSVGPFKPMKPE